MTGPHSPGEFIPRHEPAPPEPRFQLPDTAMLLQGGGLAMLAGLGFAGAVKSARRAPLLLLPVTALCLLAAALSAWAAAIHLSGGEKFDDHPWV